MIFYYLLILVSAVYQYPHMPEVFGLTTVKIVGLFAVLIACVQTLSLRQPVYLVRWIESKLFFLLCFVIVVSSVVVYSEHGNIPSLLWSYGSFAAFLLATLTFLDSFKKVETCCYVIVFSMLLAALSTFKDYVRWNIARPGGIAGDPNYYALVALCVLPMCLLLYGGNTFRKKLLLGTTAVLLAASLLLGSSRAGLIGLIFSLLYALVRMQRKVAALACVTVILVFSVLTLPRTGFDRIADTGYGSQHSIEMRIELLRAGWGMIKTHPFTGIGLGLFKPMSRQYNPNAPSQIAHNTYVDTAAELGVPALMVYMAILVLSWSRARRLANEFTERGDHMNASISRAIETGIAGFCVAALFLSASYIRHSWLLIFLGLAMQRLVAIEKEELASPAPVAPPQLATRGHQALPAFRQQEFGPGPGGPQLSRRRRPVQPGSPQPAPSGGKRPAPTRR